MKTVYLCGPINGCSDSECNDWRTYVTNRSERCELTGNLTVFYNTLDPMRRDYRGKENECVDEIVELDKIDIWNSDVVLVNYDKPSVGTSMEIFYAFERGKYVIVVCKKETVVSPWMRYHSHKIVHSFDAAIDLIGNL